MNDQCYNVCHERLVCEVERVAVLINGPSFFSGEVVESLVVMLHGRGASGDNMIAMAPKMSRSLAKTQFIAPHAGRPYGTGYTWFVDSLADMKEESACAEIMGAVEVVNRFIDAQLDAFGISDDRLSLVGFSQGAMLSIYLGLSRANKCAAVVAYSGAIPFPAALQPKIRSKPDVCVIHGTHDHVIPFSYFEQSASFLRGNGVQVVGHKIEGLDHSISSDGLEFGTRFIKDRQL